MFSTFVEQIGDNYENTSSLFILFSREYFNYLGMTSIIQ